jgi:hypothetical protein
MTKPMSVPRRRRDRGRVRQASPRRAQLAFACPLCGGHGWVREYEGETKVGCWGCGDWKGLRRLAFGDESPLPRSAKPKAVSVDPEEERAKALAVWREARAIGNMIAETYLRRRGLSPGSFDHEALRFVRSLWHWPTRTPWPAMVALIRTHDGSALRVCSETSCGIA